MTATAIKNSIPNLKASIAALVSLSREDLLKHICECPKLFTGMELSLLDQDDVRFTTVKMPSIATGNWYALGWRNHQYHDDVNERVVIAFNYESNEILFVNPSEGFLLRLPFLEAIDYADEHMGFCGEHLFQIISIVKPDTVTLEIGGGAHFTTVTDHNRIWKIAGTHIIALGSRGLQMREDCMLLKLYTNNLLVGINLKTRKIKFIEPSDLKAIHDFATVL